MPCVKADGSLTETARTLLGMLAETPMTPQDIAVKSGQPLFRTRSNLRDMVNLGFVATDGDTYSITEAGTKKI